MKYDKAVKETIKEQKKQLAMINCTCFTVLYNMGWTKEKIMERFGAATEVWNECREKGVSTFELLEAETDIEMVLDGEKSWHEFDQFSHKNRVVSDLEYIYSLYRRRRWIAPMILACMLIVFHRIDKFSYDELADFIGRTDSIRAECGERVKSYEEKMIRETGYTPKLWG